VIKPQKIKIKETPHEDMPSAVDTILKQAVFFTPTPRIEEFVHGVTDMIPTSQMGWDVYSNLYHSRDEEPLHAALLSKVTGKGAKHDHPRVARAVYESLKHHPELAHTYLKGSRRIKTI